VRPDLLIVGGLLAACPIGNASAGVASGAVGCPVASPVPTMMLTRSPGCNRVIPLDGMLTGPVAVCRTIWWGTGFAASFEGANVARVAGKLLRTSSLALSSRSLSAIWRSTAARSFAISAWTRGPSASEQRLIGHLADNGQAEDEPTLHRQEGGVDPVVGVDNVRSFLVDQPLQSQRQFGIREGGACRRSESVWRPDRR
jgi:hypothetical protein